MEYNKRNQNDGTTTNLNLRWINRLRILGGVFSHMVVEEGSGDKKKVVKVVRY